MTLVAVKCEKCGRQIEVGETATAIHAFCPLRGHGPAPTYRRTDDNR